MVKSGSGEAMRSGAIENGVDGRLQGTDQLTDIERKFVRAIVHKGGNVRDTATQLGVSRQHAHKINRRKKVQEAVRAERERLLQTDLANVAAQTMRGLLVQKQTPANVRFQAAKWCLETAGHGQKSEQNQGFDFNKSLSEMSLEELQAYISAGNQALKQMQAPKDVGPVTIDQGADSADSGESAQDSAPPDDGDDIFS